MVVGFRDMQILIEHGYSSIQPMNGPNQGAPMYQVPAAAQDILDREKNTVPGHELPAAEQSNLKSATANPVRPRRSDRTREKEAAPGETRRLRSSHGSKKTTKGR
jgi:hypothetical protein